MEPARTRAVVLRRGALVLGWMVFMGREVLVVERVFLESFIAVLSKDFGRMG